MPPSRPLSSIGRFPFEEDTPIERHARVYGMIAGIDTLRTNDLPPWNRGRALERRADGTVPNDVPAQREFEAAQEANFARANAPRVPRALRGSNNAQHSNNKNSGSVFERGSDGPFPDFPPQREFEAAQEADLARANAPRAPRVSNNSRRTNISTHTNINNSRRSHPSQRGRSNSPQTEGSNNPQHTNNNNNNSHRSRSYQRGRSNSPQNGGVALRRGEIVDRLTGRHRRIRSSDNDERAERAMYARNWDNWREENPYEREPEEIPGYETGDSDLEWDAFEEVRERRIRLRGAEAEREREERRREQRRRERERWEREREDDERMEEEERRRDEERRERRREKIREEQAMRVLLVLDAANVMADIRVYD